MFIKSTPFAAQSTPIAAIIVLICSTSSATKELQFSMMIAARVIIVVKR